MMYSREFLENLAERINKKYFPERLVSPSVLNCYDLLEAVGCDYEWKYVSPDDSIMGITFFENGAWPIWPYGTYSDDGTTVKYSKKTNEFAVIDKNGFVRTYFTPENGIEKYLKDKEKHT